MAHILLIESDSDTRSEVTSRFEREGHSVNAVDSSKDATDSVRTRKPDLLISDHKLRDGEVDFLAGMSGNKQLARVPVILLVDGDYASAVKAYECDIFAIMRKPLDIEHLVAQAETVIRQTSRQKQSRRRERAEMRRQISRLENEVQATTEDLQDAASNFVTMLASPPSPKGIRIDLHYRPSGGFVGGDFYDFFWLDSRRLAVVVGDVSGHGIQAAVIQSMARKVISIGMRMMHGDLREALRFANDEISYDIPQGKFVAAMIGVLDVVSGKWTHIRCGIPHPVLQQPGGDIEDVVTAGVALGLKRTENWADALELYETNIQPEGRIVLFTDGIIECPHEDREEFDYEGIHDVMKRVGAEVNLSDAISEAARAGHTAVDDVLIISITREEIALESEDDLPETAIMDSDDMLGFMN